LEARRVRIKPNRRYEEGFEAGRIHKGKDKRQCFNLKAQLFILQELNSGLLG
jgi:hypothetical protein